MSRPVVHCITNAVTAPRVADALAALGAEPILACAPDEVAQIARAAGALVLNCGTPSAERFATMRAAAREARAHGHPIVLDPVGCGASAWRTRCIRDLAAAAAPTVVRGNAAEVAVLAGVTDGPALRGVRSDDAEPELLERIARSASAALRAVVLATGQGTDVASDGSVAHGLTVDAAVLGHVVGAGDVLSAMIGAFLARGGAPLDATLAAHAAFAAAAGRAAGLGPGGFWPSFLDALAAHG
ncbi:MAG: hydroxyethylthiazole kinase [Candidatus Limnocylindria bacterium]